MPKAVGLVKIPPFANQSMPIDGICPLSGLNEPDKLKCGNGMWGIEMSGNLSLKLNNPLILSAKSLARSAAKPWPPLGLLANQIGRAHV